MPPNQLDQAQLDRIAESFAHAIRRGDNPTVDDYVAEQMGVANDSLDSLRSLLESIAMIEGLKPIADDVDGEVIELKQLDDYTIVREIARGGMGLVFEAIHQSLGRRVAVKVLANSLLNDPKHLARFRREARAAARLRHPNIVHVFGVGQSQDQHYYVMDYIRGLSLREWLESLTGQRGRLLPTRAESITDSDEELQIDSRVFATDNITSDEIANERIEQLSESIPVDTDSADYFRWVARVGMTVSDALQYAHDQGILHRDVKPGNLLLDHQGTVWIADFGLAKPTEQQQSVTMTGDVVGTPQYMSPEAFENSYDEASETYCLGLTLYELLTLRPAIDGKNASDTIRKASQGVTAPPRRFNRNIPRDLETIILKSLSLETDNRYQCAGDLRDDLQRFLEDRPIGARRTGLVGRTIRWTRREPALASLTLGIFASVVAMAIVAGVGYFNTNSALSDAKTARNNAISFATIADEERLLAQSNLHVAIRAFDTLSQRIAQSSNEPDAELLGDISETTTPKVSPQDAELLQAILAFYDELAQNNRGDAELKSQTAAARERAGDIYLRLGQHKKADSAFQSAIEIYSELARRSRGPESVEWVVAKTRIINNRAMLAGLQGRLFLALGLYDEAVEVVNSSEPAIRSAEGRFEYARTNTLLASLATRSGLDSVKNRKRPPFRSFAERLGIADPAPVPQRTKEEVRASKEAVDALTSLTEEFPSNLRYEIALARAYRNRSQSVGKAGMPVVAGEYLQQSIDRLADLHATHQASTSIKYELAKSISSGSTRKLGGRRLLQAQQLCDELLEAAPSAPKYIALKALVLGRQAEIQLNRRRPAEARRFLEEQSELQQTLLDTSPELKSYQLTLAQTFENIGDVHVIQGDKKTAKQYFEQSLEVWKDYPKSPLARTVMQRLNKKLPNR